MSLKSHFYFNLNYKGKWKKDKGPIVKFNKNEFSKQASRKTWPLKPLYYYFYTFWLDPTGWHGSASCAIISGQVKRCKKTSKTAWGARFSGYKQASKREREEIRRERVRERVSERGRDTEREGQKKRERKERKQSMNERNIFVEFKDIHVHILNASRVNLLSALLFSSNGICKVQQPYIRVSHKAQVQFGKNCTSTLVKHSEPFPVTLYKTLEYILTHHAYLLLCPGDLHD